MTHARFNDVRYLGGNPELTRFVRRALHVSDEGVTLWSATVDGGRLMIPAESVRSFEVLPAETATDRLNELTVNAKHGGGTFVFIRGMDSIQMVFEIVADLTVDEVRDQLASHLPGLSRHTPAPRMPADSAVVGPSSTAQFDLADKTRKVRAAITSSLVDREIPHRWDHTTLLVPSHRKGIVSVLLADLAPEATRKRLAPVHRPGGPNTAAMAEQVALLERLVSLRDAGALTPEEWEKARARAARAIGGAP